MIILALVEPDNTDAAALSRWVKLWSEKKECPVKLKRFSSSREFLRELGKNPAFDGVLFDVSAVSVLGKDSAVIMRNVDAEIPVVFISDSAEYAVKSYAVGAVDYILKPVSSSVFFRALDKLWLAAYEKTESIVLKTPGGMRRVSIKSIFYLEVNDHRTVFHTLGGDIPVWETLKKQEERLLKEIFVRCNSCFVVNLAYVETVEDFTVHLSCKAGERVSLPISRSRKAEFLKRLFAYYHEMRR